MWRSIIKHKKSIKLYQEQENLSENKVNKQKQENVPSMN